MNYDHIVVGAGAAGSVMAARLSEDPAKTVLLIESGPDYPHSKGLPAAFRYASLVFQAISPGIHNWGYRATVAENKPRTIGVPRGRIVGGSTTMHGQVFLRGIPEDFARWAEAGNSEWSFDKVLPFYIKSETDTSYKNEYHGSDGPMLVRRLQLQEASPATRAFHEACLTSGFPEDLDHNRPNTTGVGPRPINNQDGLRISTAMAYLDGARARPNLTIVPHATARKILFSGVRAVGIEAVVNGTLTQFEGKNVVLCGGVIGSAHLLMLSGIGPVADLAKAGVSLVKDLPGVGRNLQDHPVVFFFFQGTGPSSPFRSPSLQWELRTTTPGSAAPNDIQIHLSAYHGGSHLPALYRMAKRRAVSFKISLGVGLRYILQYQRRLFGFTVGLEHSLSQGEMRLVSADPTVHPSIQLRYLTEPKDRERLRYAVRLAARIGKQPAMMRAYKKAVIFPTEELLASDALLDGWIAERVESQHHACGTCKMGPVEQSDTVVDQYGRVHGVENLMIADASIMPSIISANTNATTIMIAEKIADWLRRKAVPHAE